MNKIIVDCTSGKSMVVEMSDDEVAARLAAIEIAKSELLLPKVDVLENKIRSVIETELVKAGVIVK